MVKVFALNKKSILIIAALAVIGIGIVAVFYHLSKLVEERLQQGVFADSYSVFSAPKRVVAGDVYSRDALTSYLMKIGYSSSSANPIGYFNSNGESLDVFPGKQSAFHDEPIRVGFTGGKVSEILRLPQNAKVNQCFLDPQLITSLNNQGREKRRIVKYAEIPKVLTDALLSAEDKNFFTHSGFDPLRIVRAAFVNMRAGRKEQGGSTLTMQLAKNLYLGPEKTWRRKATEFLMAGILEEKLTKQEILLHYCNQVYLGNHDTFSLHGFGEAARIYFDKDLNELTLPQAAMLAGIVQRPSYDDPIRHPERALARRNMVLTMMLRNGFITDAQAAAAASTPLGVDARSLDSAGQAPYFLDLAFDEARSHVASKAGGLGSYRIYTTLDQDLQSAAADAVRIGMERVDAIVRKRQTTPKPPASGKDSAASVPVQPAAGPQVALIAMDPHTGEIKAAIGGRSYASSQLNRLRAKRQPGSAFKPFVYTAAMETQLGGRGERFTGASMLMDEPTTFKYGSEVYEPANFGGRYMGPVTLRRALAASLNNPAVQLAQAIGYRRVVDVAKRAGMNEDIRATPAVALGAYEVTPVEVAGAYTIFANRGVYVQPIFVSTVEAQNGAVVFRSVPKTHAAIDPKVAYLMLDMLQEVLRSGTGAAVWSYGVHGPAAGKTGTSRDGWFAGFTSDLICVVWVGYDDNRDLDIEGAKSALPIWAEFMKRATQHGNYARAFQPPPSGLTTATIDDESGQLAGPLCTRTRNEYFVSGSEPTTICAHVDLPQANPIDGVTPARTEDGGGTFIPRRANGNVGMAGWFRSKSPDIASGSSTGSTENDFTAAHPDYPAGTLLRVTNISTGKSVVVEVNGRISRDSGWIISVSQRAAEALDFMRTGSAEVRVEPVEKR
jgi:penicillin-binding protein 1B